MLEWCLANYRSDQALHQSLALMLHSMMMKQSFCKIISIAAANFIETSTQQSHSIARATKRSAQSRTTINTTLFYSG
jgi:hypothetical protein